MTTRRQKDTRRDAPVYSEKEWDFRFGPIRVSGAHSLASLSTHWAEVQSVLLGYIVEAMQDHRLPLSAVLTQFISVPPQQDHIKINLKVPAVVRTSVPGWKNYIRSFCVPAHFARSKEGFSFHNRAAEELLDTPAGTILVFTANQKAPTEHIFGGVNLIWVQMPSIASGLAPHLADVLIDHATGKELSSKLISADIGKIVEDRRNHSALTVPDSESLTAEVRIFPKWGLTPVEQDQLHDFTLSLFGSSGGCVAFNEYLSHVAASVCCGPVILAQPKKVFFEQSHNQNRLIDNSGISVHFRAATKIHYKEIEDTFRIAHRLSTAFTSLYGIAQARAHDERSEGAKEAFRMVRHSLTNAIAWLPSNDLQTKSILHLERFVLDAAAFLTAAITLERSRPEVAWHMAGVDGEPLDHTLIRAVSIEKRVLNIDCACLCDRRPDSRFVALLVELSRNAIGHAPSGIANIYVAEGDVKGTVNVTVRSDCIYTAYTNTLDYCEQFVDDQNRDKGAHFALRLMQSIACERTVVRYCIGSEKQGDALVRTWPFKQGESITVVGRKDVKAAETADNTETYFPFVAELRNLRIL